MEVYTTGKRWAGAHQIPRTSERRSPEQRHSLALAGPTKYHGRAKDARPSNGIASRWRVAAFIVLLQPCSLLAQCNQDDWYGTTTTVAPTVFALASTSPQLLISDFDTALYKISLVQSNLVSDVQFNLNGSPYQIASCWPGKVFIIEKYTQGGQLLWHKTGCFTYDGLVNGMAVDDLGNLYFGGYFTGELSYDDSTISQSPTNIWTHYTIKVDADGGVSWFRSGLRSSATGHMWTENGLLVFLAFTDSTTFNGQPFYHLDSTIPATTEYVALMVDSEGEIVWDKHLGGYGNKFIRKVSCGSGICVVQGTYMSAIAYDNLYLNNGSGRIFQLAINSNDGSGIWMKDQSNYESAVFTNCSSILEDGSLITAGHYIGSPSVFSFQGETIASGNGLTDGFVMRQNVSTGELIWLKTLGAPGYSSINGMAKTASGVVITGEYDSPSLGYEGLNLVNHSDLRDPFIILIDTMGKPACQFDNLGISTPESGNKILTTGNDVFLLLGFNDSTSFGDFQVNSSGNGDYLIWKTCLPCDTLTSIAENLTPAASLSIYPNPASQSVRVEVAGSHAQAMGITITDMLGHAVLSLPFREVGEAINISNLANGIYTIAATMQSGETLRQRLVVQH